jgi:hypothetical protein
MTVFKGYTQSNRGMRETKKEWGLMVVFYHTLINNQNFQIYQKKIFQNSYW